jgi:hypothetical protein
MTKVVSKRSTGIRSTMLMPCSPSRLVIWLMSGARSRATRPSLVRNDSVPPPVNKAETAG